jgi:hypothetical protein
MLLVVVLVSKDQSPRYGSVEDIQILGQSRKQLQKPGSYERLILPELGHCVPAEAPQEVVAAIEKLLRMPEQRLESTSAKLYELEQSARD